MPVIITVTSEPTTVDNSDRIYDYRDKILKNVCKNIYEVYYSGQNLGRDDRNLIKAITNNEMFKVYYRPKKKMPFTYLGDTNNIDIIQYRTLPVNINTNDDQRLKIHLIINNITNSSVPTNNFTGSGKFKKDIFVHAGLRNTNNSSIIQHKRNTNLGFYCY